MFNLRKGGELNMKMKMIMGLIIISVVITSISGCVEQEEKEKEQQEQEQEIKYDDVEFLLWIEEDAGSTSYYNDKIQEEMAKDFEDTSFDLLIYYSEMRMEIIEQSQKELENFYLSPDYEEIRQSWKSALMDRWFIDWYLILRIETITAPVFNEEDFSLYSDAVVDFTISADEHVTEATRLIEEL